jgi:hypothetical protein
VRHRIGSLLTGLQVAHKLQGAQHNMRSAVINTSTPVNSSDDFFDERRDSRLSQSGLFRKGFQLA